MRSHRIPRDGIERAAAGGDFVESAVMMQGQLIVRTGGSADTAAVLGLFDRAVEWLVARGRTGQWGSRPFSTDRRRIEEADGWAVSGGLRIAEIGGVVAGAIVLGAAPPYVPAVHEPELYLQAFVTDRALAGRGVGRALLDRAAAEAMARGTPLLRIDCWAGGDGALVRYYQRAGFTPTERFAVGDWQGQVLARHCG
jgi:ribosomal protein S18 acetylase RimI-like enzyme